VINFSPNGLVIYQMYQQGNLIQIVAVCLTGDCWYSSHLSKVSCWPY